MECGGGGQDLGCFKSKEMRTEGVKPKQAKETSAPVFLAQNRMSGVLRSS